jgi:hypothetical protein
VPPPCRRLFAAAEEAALAERPRAADQRQLCIGAVEPREPAFGAGLDVHVLVQAFGHVLDAAKAADGARIGGCQGRGGSEPGLAVAEALLRGRMVVLLHRVVFGMERQPEKGVGPLFPGGSNGKGV